MATRSPPGAAPSASRLVRTREGTPGELRPGRAAEGVCSRGAARTEGRPGRSRVREISASCFLGSWNSAPGVRSARTPGGADRPLGSAGQPGMVQDARAPFRSHSAVCAPDPSRRLCPESLVVAPALPGPGEAPGGPGPEVLACNRHPRVSAAELLRPRTGCLSCIRETRKYPHHELAKSSLLPTPVFLPRVSHGQRILAGHSPWGRTESDTTESSH